MFRKTSDFVTVWNYEAATTIKLFSLITNEVMNKKDNENIRSIARLCWHITLTVGEMANRAGLHVNCPDEHTAIPSAISEIIATYTTAADSLKQEVTTKWTDEALTEEVDMYGDKWTKGAVLSVLIRHQSHHRGQLTILMRNSGLKVIGVYGPAKEEWAQLNMPPMD